MTISSTTVKNSYSGNGTLDTFNYTFKIFANTDLQVIIRDATATETVKTLTTHYTVTGAGSASGGTIVFTAGNIPSATETVVIRRAVPQTQAIDYIANDPFPAESHEEGLDRAMMTLQQLQEEVDRSIKLSRTNTMNSTEFTIGDTERVNKVFGFDSAGELVVTQELGTFRGNWSTSTAFAVRDIIKDTSNNNIYICLTAHTSSGSQPISTNTDVAKWGLLVDAYSATASAASASASASAAATSESNAATSESNASTSASNAATSETNASNSASAASTSETNAAASYDSFDDRYLGAKATDPSVDNDGDALIDGALYFDTTLNVMKVYDLGTTSWKRTTPTSAQQTAIDNVDGISADVTTVSGISGNVTTVASNDANITTVATNIASVNTVATDIAKVIAVADDLAEAVSEVETVANDLNEATSEIEVVANNIANVNSVGTNIANVNTVGTNIANVNTVATNNANITTVAGINADVTTVANDGTDIGTVATNIANVNTVAGNNANINTVAGNDANITTVAGISSNVTTVANDTADIGTVAGSIANVNLVGGSIANVNTVATNIASVNNFGDRYRVGSTNPIINNDEGDLFYNTTDDTFYVWTGSTWEAITDRAEALQAIATTKNDTAVDVFIYDTRKDSDGGAWRKRTQNTSWYNETLNTATRGSRKEFPAVAVIVVSYQSVIKIYDGDDPSLPFWGDHSIGKAVYSADSVSSVTALNGQVFVGYSSGYGGYLSLNYASDTWTYWGFGDGSNGFGFFVDSIYSSARNGDVSAGNTRGTVYTSAGYLVSYFINDVAMTVLPNAPIDNATRLPVPTIAVATSNGVSVIKDDGTVVDLTSASGNEFSSVNFYNEYLVIGNSNKGAVWYYNNIPSSDETLSPTNGHIEYYDPNFTNQYAPSYLGYLETKVEGSYAGTEGERGGLTAIDFNNSDYTESNTAFITSDYNTGWMNGDIKLATLSDTDDTNITGSELVTNGTFDTDISGWSDGSGAGSSISWDSTDGGRMSFDGSAAYAFASYGFSTVSGKSYTVKYEVKVTSTGSGNFLVGTSNYSQNILNKAGDHNNVGFKTHTFVATGGTSYITIKDGYSSLRVDNVSVRECVPDRSYNNKGLQVFGTIDKNAVATGSDLVSYSSWSSVSYLEDTNSEVLTFGTGDFTIAFWIKTTDGYATVCTTLNGQYGMHLALNSAVTSVTIRSGQTASNTLLTDDNWHQFIVSRKNNVVQYYFDGVPDGSYTDARDFTATGIRIGVRGDGGQNLSGNLALFRVSHSSITDEQASKMYHDEKFLFQENAKATLYGTSNAVTALAYDDTTKLLHAGTSSGRSVFNGLRRVDNTTDAVGTSISASNGLVVDE